MTTRIGLLLSLAIVAVACSPKDDGSQVRLNGRIEAPLVDLAPKVTGRVVDVRVREGARVKAGDLLIVLDLGDTAVNVERDRHGVESARARLQDLAVGSRQAEVAGAEADVTDKMAALDLAKREMQRQDLLLSKDVGTERDHDQAQTQLERAHAALRISEEKLALTREGFRTWQTAQARSEVDKARAQLRQSEIVARESEIRAPADAVVTHRMVEPGQLLAAGQTGMTLALTGRLYVRTFIPETKLGRVKHGQAAQVAVDAFPGKTFEAVVTEIAPDAEFTPKQVETREERVNLVYGAKVDLMEGWGVALVPGQPAEITLTAAEPVAAAGLRTPGAPSAQVAQNAR
jgi:HlyD family secretion protein